MRPKPLQHLKKGTGPLEWTSVRSAEALMTLAVGMNTPGSVWQRMTPSETMKVLSLRLWGSAHRTQSSMHTSVQMRRRRTMRTHQIAPLPESSV
jgi:hypothetical protein